MQVCVEGTASVMYYLHSLLVQCPDDSPSSIRGAGSVFSVSALPIAVEIQSVIVGALNIVSPNLLHLVFQVSIPNAIRSGPAGAEFTIFEVPR